MDLNDLKFEFEDLNFQINDIVEWCYKMDENIKQDDKHVYRLLDIYSISRFDKTVILEFHFTYLYITIIA